MNDVTFEQTMTSAGKNFLNCELLFGISNILALALQARHVRILPYILNKSENATLQLSIFCEKVLDKTYLLKLNTVSQTSSKPFVETLPICLV